MSKIRVKSIEEIPLKSGEINRGNGGVIYLTRAGDYFKLLNPEYRFWQNSSNYNRLRILEKLMGLGPTNYLALPKDIYVTDEALLGFTMNICNGIPLGDFADNIKYGDIVRAFNNILKEIRFIYCKYGYLQ